MKHCPACNFSFPDFHLVCDFDGTELVPDQQRLALIRFHPRRSFIRRFLTSPKTVTALAILGLFFIAAFIAFQQMNSRSTRTLLTATVASPHLEMPATASPREPGAAVPRVARPNQAARVPARARLSAPVRLAVRREKRNEDLSPQTEVAHRSGSASSAKQPKVVAMLKTTWRVLKKPFTF